MIYEFKCDDCDLVYEEFHEIGDNESWCPNCAKPAKRIMSVCSSNFSEWSETVDRLSKWSIAHENGNDTTS